MLPSVPSQFSLKNVKIFFWHQLNFCLHEKVCFPNYSTLYWDTLHMPVKITVLHILLVSNLKVIIIFSHSNLVNKSLWKSILHKNIRYLKLPTNYDCKNFHQFWSKISFWNQSNIILWGLGLGPPSGQRPALIFKKKMIRLLTLALIP